MTFFTALATGLAAVASSAALVGCGSRNTDSILSLPANAEATIAVVQPPPHPCLSAGSLSTQKGCRSVTSVVGSR